MKKRATATGNFECVYCAVKTPITFAIPRFLECEYIQTTCAGCESQFKIKLKRVNTQTNDQFHQWVSTLFQSEKAIQIEKAQKARSNYGVKNPYDRQTD